MSNKLSPLSNSTPALLELQIWSDAASHATQLTCHVQKLATNQFELVTASLNHVLPMQKGSTPWPLLEFPIFPSDDL